MQVISRPQGRDRVPIANRELTAMIDADRAIGVFRALADPIRLRIVRLLVDHRTQMCVCEFVDTLQERQTNVSRHLKALRSAGLIRGKKTGRWVYYGLAAGKDPILSRLGALIARLPDAAGLFAADRRRLASRMALRTDGRCQAGIQTPGLSG